MNNYLNHVEENTPDSIGSNSDITMEDFRKILDKYYQVDNYLKKLKTVGQEKKKQKENLTKIITCFMDKYQIEDINTNGGRIRFKRSFVKVQPSKKEIRNKLEMMLIDNSSEKNKILSLFQNNEKVEKVTLRRLKIE